MGVDVNIGPYMLRQRTEYSKIQILNRFTGEDVSLTNPHLANKLADDYYKQKNNLEKYFEINGDILVGINSAYIGNAEGVFLPDNIKIIEDKVFEGASFKNIHFPSSLEYIGDYAFNDCTQLNLIELPDVVSQIGIGAFQHCTKLKTAKLPSKIQYINSQVFSGCSSLKNINIPDTVVAIRPSAFSYCGSLESLVFPDRLRMIEGSAFAGCDSLKHITLPEGLRTIHSGCFSECINLEDVSIPDSVNILGSCAFMGCKNLRYIKLSNSLHSLPGNLFTGCEKLREIIIPNNVSKISENVFTYTESLENVTLPESLLSISFRTFVSSAVKSLTINYDIPDLTIYKDDSSGAYKSLDCGIFKDTSINKLIISKDVNVISESLLGTSGKQITKIDFSGTMKEFDELEKNNKKFFELLPNLEEINLLEDNIFLRTIGKER